MKNRMILTPYFLDGEVTGLKELAQEDWRLNEPPMRADDVQGRMIDLYRPLAQAVQSAVAEGHVIRPVVGERPAEHVAVEALDGGDVGGGEFHVVHRVVWRIGHGQSPEEFRCVSR